jgi:hypothetical protein
MLERPGIAARRKVVDHASRFDYDHALREPGRLSQFVRRQKHRASG